MCPVFTIETGMSQSRPSARSRWIAGVSSSPTNMPCIHESPRTIPRACAFGSGAGPRRPQELVVCAEGSSTIAPAAETAARTSGVSGTRKRAGGPPWSVICRIQTDRRLGSSRYDRPFVSGA